MPAVAVRPVAVAGGVPRRAAPVPLPAASGKKRPRVGGEMSSQEVLKKRMASELDVLHGLLKKAELISRGACKGGGAPTAAGKKEQQFMASKPRSEPIDDAGAECTPSAKRRKISALVEPKPKPKPKPKQMSSGCRRMSPEGRNQLVGRMSSLSGEVPGYIAEFLQKQFGDAGDAHGESEIEINFDAVQDSLLFELKARLDKFAVESKIGKVAEKSMDNKLAEESQNNKIAKETKDGGKVAEKGKDNKFTKESKGDKLAEESKNGKVAKEGKDGKLTEETKDSKVVAEERNDDKVAEESKDDQSPSKPVPFVVSPEEMKAQAVKCAAARAIYIPGLIYRANMRRELMEMERALALLPAESTVHPRELQGLCIKEYGRPSVMRHIGLVLKADALVAES